MKLNINTEEIPKKIPVDRQAIIKEIVDILENKKCENISILNLEEVNSYLSIFIICTVKTTTQGKAVCKDLVKSMKGYKLNSGVANKVETSLDSGWILVDLGEIFVHIMTQELRNYYDLDRLWGDAKPIAV